MKPGIYFILLFTFAMPGCSKIKQNTCLFGECDSRRVTKLVAQSWEGRMIYNNTIDKWGITSVVIGNPQNTSISYICGSFNDSFKVINKAVFFSGSLKESCDNPRRLSFNDEIYYILPTLLR